jgi:hypothetical protein
MKIPDGGSSSFLKHLLSVGPEKQKKQNKFREHMVFLVGGDKYCRGHTCPMDVPHLLRQSSVKCPPLLLRMDSTVLGDEALGISCVLARTAQ